MLQVYNAREIYSPVLKRLLEWREVPDLVSEVHSLYYLQTFYFKEIQRGMIGVGAYKLRKEFQSLLQDPDDVQILKCYDPDEIIETDENK